LFGGTTASEEGIGASRQIQNLSETGVLDKERAKLAAGRINLGYLKTTVNRSVKREKLEPRDGAMALSPLLGENTPTKVSCDGTKASRTSGLHIFKSDRNSQAPDWEKKQRLTVKFSGF